MSSIDVFCRISSTARLEGRSTAASQPNESQVIRIIDSKNVQLPGATNRTEFKQVYGSSAKLLELYGSCVDDLLSFLRYGYNTSLVIIGETNSGQDFLLNGDPPRNVSRRQDGLLDMIIKNICNVPQDPSSRAENTPVQTPQVMGGGRRHAGVKTTSQQSGIVNAARNSPNAPVVAPSRTQTQQTDIQPNSVVPQASRTDGDDTSRVGEMIRSWSRVPSNLDVNFSESIHLKVLEIHNENVVDLLQGIVPGSALTGSAGIIEDDLEGVVLENFRKLEVSDAPQCIETVQRALAASHWSKTGAVKDESTVVFEFSSNKLLNTSQPSGSWFRVVKLPGTEPLGATPFVRTQTSQSIITFANVVTLLSENAKKKTSPQLITFRDSLLTLLLRDVVYGNSFTRCVCTLKDTASTSTPALVSCVLQLGGLLTFPVENTLHTKGLLRTLRKQTKLLEQNLEHEVRVNKAHVNELKQELASLSQTNEHLRAEASNREGELEKLQLKFSNAIATHTRVTSQAVGAENDRLGMSKEVIELKLQLNKFQQEAEKQLFDTKNKYLSEKEKSTNAERNLAFETKVNADWREKYERLTKERKDLTDEYINLKSNYVDITDEHRKQATLNEDLASKLNALVKSKERMMEERQHMEYTQIKEFTEQLQGLAQNFSETSSKDKGRGSTNITSLESQNLRLEKQILHGQQSREDGLANQKEQHETELNNLQNLLSNVQRKLSESEESIERYKTNFSRLTSEMLILRDQKENAESGCKSLVAKTDQFMVQYRDRLQTYINDLKEFILNNERGASSEAPLAPLDAYKSRVELLVEELRSSFNVSVEQLQARRGEELMYMRDLINKHEKLLSVYKLLKLKAGYNDEVIEELQSLEILLPPDSEVEAIQVKERNELRTRLLIEEQQVKDLQDKIISLKSKQQNIEESGKITETKEPLSWSQARRQIHEFTVGLQAELEKERAELKTRCVLAEQELVELQSHLQVTSQRYEHEIDHLRRLLSDVNARDDRAYQPAAGGRLAIEPPRDVRGQPPPLPPIQHDYRYQDQPR